MQPAGFAWVSRQKALGQSPNFLYIVCYSTTWLTINKIPQKAVQCHCRLKSQHIQKLGTSTANTHSTQHPNPWIPRDRKRPPRVNVFGGHMKYIRHIQHCAGKAAEPCSGTRYQNINCVWAVLCKTVGKTPSGMLHYRQSFAPLPKPSLTQTLIWASCKRINASRNRVLAHVSSNKPFHHNTAGPILGETWKPHQSSYNPNIKLKPTCLHRIECHCVAWRVQTVTSHPSLNQGQNHPCQVLNKGKHKMMTQPIVK